MAKTNRSSLLAFLLGVALIVTTRAADITIYLRNGDRVTGSIAAESATEITLQTRSLGKVTIPVADILKRENVPAATAPQTNTVAVVSTNKPAASTNIVAAVPPVTKPAPPKHWNSELQLGLNLRYSSKDQQEALVIAKSTYARTHFREILDYNFTYGTTEGIRSANKMIGSSKTEYDLTDRWYLFNLAGGSYDEVRQIDRQFEFNPGIGFTWIKKPDLVFKTEVGFGYQDQFFQGGQELSTYAGRLAAIFNWRIYDKLTAEGRLEYFPNVKSIDEYRFRAESTLRYPLSKVLSLNLVVIDLYDTQLPPGVQNNDLQVRSAVGVKF